MSSRVLRDDLWTSEPIDQLHDKTFRLYVCLINAADDYGLVETGFGHICRAAPLKRWNGEEVAKMLGELTDSKVILPYSVTYKGYAAIDKWQAFIRSMKPRCPMPTFGMGHVRMPYGFKNSRVRLAASLILKHLDIKDTTPGSTQGSSGDDLGHEGNKELGVGKKGRREKEVKKKKPARPSIDASPFPTDFQLTESMFSSGLKLGLTREEISRAFIRFCDNAQAKGHMYASWPAAFRTWCGFNADRKRKEDPPIDLTEGGKYVVS